MARALRLACGVALVVAAACSLTTSLDGLADTVPDGGPDSSATDGVEDARGAADVAQTHDAGLADAPFGGPFCDGVRGATFCDDFERQNPGFGWDAVFVSADASVTITAAPSTPSSVLHVVVPRASVPDAAASAGAACLSKGFAHATRARVSFDALLETVGASTRGALVQVYTVNDAGTTTEQLEIGAGANSLEEGVYPARVIYPHALKRNLKIGAWERVTVVLTMDTSPATISISFGDEVVLPETPAHAAPGDVGLYLALASLQIPPEAWSIYVDNVVVELTP